MSSRQELCRRTAQALRERREDLAAIPVLCGFDGFIDEICGVVETRGPAGEPATVPTIDRLARKIAGAAGQSSNYEILVRRVKIGGNGPIMADALARLGLDVTYVGNLGYPDLDPIFSDFARRADVRSIAPPAHTDALEFEDGKLMLGKLEPLAEITWENMTRRLGPETFEHLLSRSRLIGMVNWTMIPQMSRIWARLIADVLPQLPESRHGRRAVFIDLADPEKRTRDDLRYALRLLAKMQEHVDVTLGLNLKEARQVCGVLGIACTDDAQNLDIAAGIRGELELDCCVVHPRTGAAAATFEDRADVPGPFTRQPKISTGAGDHFNAGFVAARLLGLQLDACLCAGVATSGHYVRTARSPDAQGLADFIESLPDPEESGG